MEPASLSANQPPDDAAAQFTRLAVAGLKASLSLSKGRLARQEDLLDRIERFLGWYDHDPEVQALLWDLLELRTERSIKPL